MFTRIPTFIPTESNALETVKEQPSHKREAKKPVYGIGGETSRRRKRAKAIKKRIAAKKAEDKHCEALPVISGRESRARGHTMQTQTHLRSSKLFQSRATSFAAPYTTPVQKERIILDLNRKAATLSESSDTKSSKETTVGAILSMETELGEEADVLTHATMHTRHRRKLTDDTQDLQVKKQAKRLFHNHVEHEVMNMDITSRAGTSSNESTTSDSQSLTRTPLPADIQSSLRSPKTHHNETETSRNFKSKIPVRFPEIQENKRYTESRAKNTPNKLTTPLPPIANLNSSKNSPDSTGNVTQSIMDYQNIVEQDFKRLGENLENTFKLLHQYIKCNSNTHARA